MNNEARHVFDFGEALKELKRGNKVTRHGWNGKDMHLFLVENLKLPYIEGSAVVYDRYDSLPFIAMKTAQDAVVPWLASQADLLANDWYISLRE